MHCFYTIQPVYLSASLLLPLRRADAGEQHVSNGCWIPVLPATDYFAGTIGCHAVRAWPMAHE
eukprot:1142874-Pelagomonas_calceolata.AAC.3